MWHMLVDTVAVYCTLWLFGGTAASVAITFIITMVSSINHGMAFWLGCLSGLGLPFFLLHTLLASVLYMHMFFHIYMHESIHNESRKVSCPSNLISSPRVT